MMIDVTDRLLPDKSKIDELEIFLGTRGDSSQSRPGIVEYDGARIKIKYTTKKHKLKSIHLDAGKMDGMFKKLESDVREALSDDGEAVTTRYLHSRLPVKGFFKHNDSFQLLPPPDDAPQADQQIADHPFRIEFKHSKNENHHITNYRTRCRLTELSFVLNGLVPNLSLCTRNSSKEWAIVRDDQDKWTSKFVQLSYFGTESPEDKDESGFSVVDNVPAISLIHPKSYYALHSTSCFDSLSLPSFISELISQFDRLEAGLKNQFLRASYWRHVSSSVYSTSASASFAALVNAIEVFLPNPSSHCGTCDRPTSEDRCDECNQPVLGPTKQFRAFIEKYAPGGSDKERKDLYSIRSALVHGSTLLPGDIDELSWRHTTAANDTYQQRMILNQLVQICMVNWLAIQASPAPMQGDK